MIHLLIAADHAGYDVKEFLVKELQKLGYKLQDLGTNSTNSVDYPDVIHPLAKEINDGKTKFGIILCGSGNGVNMTANKYPNVRSALCWLPELARLARQHNDANIVAIPARFVDKDTALQIVLSFLETAFEGGRHTQRVRKISVG